MIGSDTVFHFLTFPTETFMDLDGVYDFLMLCFVDFALQ